MNRAVLVQLDAVLSQLARLRADLQVLCAKIDAAEGAGAGSAFDDVLDLVASRLALPRERILSRSRNSRAAAARQIVIWLGHDAADLSISTIARALDRDRATIRYLRQCVVARRDSDAEYRARLDALAVCVRGSPPSAARRAA